MKKVNTYIQKKNALHEVQNYITGKKTLIVLGAFRSEYFIEKITASLRYDYECIVFDQECTYDNIMLLKKKMEEGFDSIIGFGGGKVLDVVKAVSYYYPCFLMVIPSSASMDGACSALSVLYHEDHSFDRFLYLDKNPDVVLVDSQVIFDAPFSLLCAGMADAVSSYYDMEYAIKKKELNEVVIACAKECKRIYTLYQQAKQDYEQRILSDVIEQVIHINIYESAVAFENTDLEFSHVLANASTKIVGSKGMHGERVGVSTLFQLILENKVEERKQLYHMLMDLQMPTTLKEMQIEDASLLEEAIMKEFQQLHIDYDMDKIRQALDQIK